MRWLILLMCLGSAACVTTRSTGGPWPSRVAVPDPPYALPPSVDAIYGMPPHWGPPPVQ